MSGLLQMLDFSRIYETFEKLASIVKPGGSLWIDTFNYDYKTILKRRSSGLWYFRKTELEALMLQNNFQSVDCKTFNSKLEINNQNQGMYIAALGNNKI